MGSAAAGPSVSPRDSPIRGFRGLDRASDRCRIQPVSESAFGAGYWGSERQRSARGLSQKKLALLTGRRGRKDILEFGRHVGTARGDGRIEAQKIDPIRLHVQTRGGSLKRLDEALLPGEVVEDGRSNAHATIDVSKYSNTNLLIELGAR